jgi:hypothetical protein
MSKLEAQTEAVRIAVSKLQQIDILTRCALLKLPAPVDGRLNLRAFGTDFFLTTDTFELFLAQSGKAAKEADRILILHLLLCEQPLAPSFEMISFRDFPGGAFYLEPFLSRTVRPLIKRHGNNLVDLEKVVHRFDFEKLDIGDFSVRIHAVGCLYVTFVYRIGDDEFPASAELFFNLPTKRALCAEDAAVLAGRICFGLF